MSQHGLSPYLQSTLKKHGGTTHCQTHPNHKLLAYMCHTHICIYIIITSILHSIPLYIPIWLFPKIGVPQIIQVMDDQCIKTHGDLGYHCRKPPFFTLKMVGYTHTRAVFRHFSPWTSQMLVSMVCWALAPVLAVPEAVGKPWSVEEVHGDISTLWGW